MIMKRKKGYFSISAVAHMFSVHQQTIRLYEREGLICPKRSEGNTRLFSEEDIARLEEVMYLTHKLGINLAGVDMILKQQKKIDKLQNEINSLFQRVHDDLAQEQEATTGIITEATQRLARLKKIDQHQQVPQPQQTSLITRKKTYFKPGGDSYEPS